MKSWKRRWKDELDHIVPSLDQKVKNAPIVSAEGRAVKGNKRRLKKPVMAFAMCCVAIIVVCCVVLPITLNTDKDVRQVNAVILEINPQAVFDLDSNGTVLSVLSLNEDADIILSDDSRVQNIKGKPLEEALQIFIDYSARLGYLDLSAQDAVRVTFCDKEQRLDEVSKKLQSYFMDKGAFTVVVSDVIGYNEFAQKAGFSKDDDLSEIFGTVSTLLSERNSGGKNIEEIQQLYKDYIEFEGIVDTYIKELRANIDRITQNISALQEIFALNAEIMNSEDNPIEGLAALLGKDYWSVKKYDNKEPYTEGFDSLMKRMDGLLVEYAENYGESFDTMWELVDMINLYNRLPLNMLYELLDNFNIDSFESNLDTLTSILRIIGSDLSDLEEWCAIPQSVAEYVEKTKQFANARFGELTEKFADIYNAQRDTISAEEYDSYVQSIIAQYGSLAQYWDAVKK